MVMAATVNMMVLMRMMKITEGEDKTGGNNSDEDEVNRKLSGCVYLRPRRFVLPPLLVRAGPCSLGDPTLQLVNTHNQPFVCSYRREGGLCPSMYMCVCASMLVRH